MVGGWGQVEGIFVGAARKEVNSLKVFWMCEAFGKNFCMKRK